VIPTKKSLESTDWADQKEQRRQHGMLKGHNCWQCRGLASTKNPATGYVTDKEEVKKTMTHEEAQTRMRYVIGKLYFLDILMAKLQQQHSKLCEEEAALLNEFPTLESRKGA